MPTPPELFFRDFVLRAYEEFMTSPRVEEYLAKNAAHNANVMADRMWKHFSVADPPKVYGSRTVGVYRSELVGRECDDFQLVWDVDDGFKHVELDRPSRRVSTSDQTGKGSIGWDEGRWDETSWDGPEEIVITLDDASKRPFAVVIENVVRMWERLLR